MSQIVEDAIVGQIRFGPAVEEWLSQQLKDNPQDRAALIESILWEEMKRQRAQESTPASYSGKRAGHPGNTDILTREALALAESPPPSSKRKR